MLSAVILTKNEENNILDCIDRLSFCNEIIIIDDKSQDRTIEIVKKLKDKRIKIISRELKQNFSAQRNSASDEITQPWVLYIDPDERISEELKIEIVATIQAGKFPAYYLKRRDHVWNTMLSYGEQGSIRLLRLIRSDIAKSRIWKGKVHEVMDFNDYAGELVHPLDHYPHRSIRSFVDKINMYSTIRAQELYDQKHKTNFFEIILYPVGKFFVNYILKKGYKDGNAGFVAAMMMSFHSFLVRSKLFLTRYEK